MMVTGIVGPGTPGVGPGGGVLLQAQQQQLQPPPPGSIVSTGGGCYSPSHLIGTSGSMVGGSIVGGASLNHHDVKIN